MNTIEITSNGPIKKDSTRMKSVVACASKDFTRPSINLVLEEKVKGGITVSSSFPCSSGHAALQPAIDKFSSVPKKSKTKNVTEVGIKWLYVNFCGEGS